MDTKLNPKLMTQETLIEYRKLKALIRIADALEILIEKK